MYAAQRLEERARDEMSAGDKSGVAKMPKNDDDRDNDGEEAKL